MSKNSIHIEYDIVSHEDLSSSIKALFEKMQLDIGRAYAPYSGLSVVSGLLLENESIIIGTNQENSILPLGICAERAALLSYPNQSTSSIKAIGVTCSPWNKSELPLFPCGSCRQTIVEFELRQSKPIAIYLFHSNGKVWHFNSAKELLPFSIDETFLEDFQ